MEILRQVHQLQLLQIAGKVHKIHDYDVSVQGGFYEWEGNFRPKSEAVWSQKVIIKHFQP